MEKTWRDAIIKVLSEAETPLHYTEISEQIFANGYYHTDGATPAATVNAQISASIKHDGERSPFIRVGKGTFSLKQPNSSAATLKVRKDEIVNNFETEPNDSIILRYSPLSRPKSHRIKIEAG